MKKVIMFLALCFLVILTVACGPREQALRPLPNATKGHTMDAYINVETGSIDNWLNRPDVVYIDLRMFHDPAKFYTLPVAPPHGSSLTTTIEGFTIFPLPYIVNLPILPVPNGFIGKSLFSVTWGPNRAISNLVVNFPQSMEILEFHFPKDTAIFLMCGGGGYSSAMAALLIYLGWEDQLVFNVGGNWFYDGDYSIDLIIRCENGEPKFDAFGRIKLAPWRVRVIDLDFSNKLASLPNASPNPKCPFGIDLNINISTIDKWLFRPDVAYFDLGKLRDTAQFPTPNLHTIIAGFTVVSFPFIGTVEIPVPGAYRGTSLFNIDWIMTTTTPAQNTFRINSVTANFEESYQFLVDTFPQDKAIFLVCGAGGYSAHLRALLVYFGWDASLIFNVGSRWTYGGNFSFDITLRDATGVHILDAQNRIQNDFKRFNYILINFDELTPLI